MTGKYLLGLFEVDTLHNITLVSWSASSPAHSKLFFAVFEVVHLRMIVFIVCTVGFSSISLDYMDHPSYVLTLLFTLAIGAGIGFYVARIIF